MASEKSPPLAPSTTTALKERSHRIGRKNYGIYDMTYVEQSAFNFVGKWDENVAGARVYVRLLKEIYDLVPWITAMFLLSRFWRSIEDAVLLHLSSDLLTIIEVGLKEGDLDRKAIGWALVMRLSCITFVSWFKWWVDTLKPVIKSKVVNHYEIELMRARMHLDLSSTSQDPTTGSGGISSETPWNAFESVIEFLANGVTFCSQIFLVLHATRSTGGPVMGILSILQPLYQVLGVRNMWNLPLLVNMGNKYYSRMKALRKLTDQEYKHEYIAGGLSDYVLMEYEKAAEDLGETSIDDVWEQVNKHPTPYSSIAGEVLGDLPIIYCAYTAVTNPSNFSLASIAILQQSTSTIRWSMHAIAYTVRSFQRHISEMKKMYAALEIKPRLKGGEVSYPRKDLDSEKSGGMGIELRDVRFDYPETKSTTSALKGISLTIKPGNLVVIVGANGSGKSTLIKLITRMYDATSGVLSVDGLPVSNYRTSDFRQTIASFTQDHKLYPLSLYENIGLGNYTQIHDKESVMKAAELGGATGFISKLEDGMETVLEPMLDYYTINVPDDDETHPLKQEEKKILKKADISGGERQRVVAARTFMHINSGRVKLVAVDEPSSALDSEAELALFQRLIEAREGKTMIFVTHRFGHLTKYADVIVCMKEGEIVELGPHWELMQVGGEYAKLYNIQAEAFADGGKDSLPS